ncbi:MAG: molybdopterin molybdotransferase MoeA, partial [Acidimicrobiia bacterium]|nr:molybdopterin molybdotransferase MoeA [Acidimicrobiia bacterium]
LAEDVIASHDLPPFPNSAMDGFAVRSADVSDPPVELQVIDEVAAGSVASESVRPGTAIKIMTGAPMPDGADAVVKVEDTEQAESTRVRILATAPAGTALRPAGGDVPKGTNVLESGERLGPAHLGVLASLGVAFPTVRQRPVVAIMSTGDEVTPPDTQVLGPGKIRDSNRFILAGLLEEAGAVVIDRGIVPDDAGKLRSVLGHAASQSDVVVTSGGVSMGEHDVVKEVFAGVGEVEFWRVAMQPAKPFGFGSIGGVPFFGLPGNPVSVAVAFEQYLRPALLSMIGSTRLFRPRLAGTITENVSTDPAKEVFLRVRAEYVNGNWSASLSGGQWSNVLSALAAANAYAVIPVGRG